MRITCPPIAPMHPHYMATPCGRTWQISGWIKVVSLVLFAGLGTELKDELLGRHDVAPESVLERVPSPASNEALLITRNEDVSLFPDMNADDLRISALSQFAPSQIFGPICICECTTRDDCKCPSNAILVDGATQGPGTVCAGAVCRVLLYHGQRSKVHRKGRTARFFFRDRNHGEVKLSSVY